MVQRKRKLSEIEKDVKEKAINEVVLLTNCEENMLNANIIREKVNGVEDKITAVSVETVSKTFNWCSGCKELKIEVNSLKTEVDSLKEKINRDNQLVHLSDLGRMFRFYIADSVMKEKFNYSSWGNFLKVLYDKKARFSDGEISDTEFYAFVNPINTELQLDIISLTNFVQDQNSNCHNDISSKTGQLEFIKLLKSTTFYGDLKPLVTEMLERLEGVTLKRMN